MGYSIEATAPQLFSLFLCNYDIRDGYLQAALSFLLNARDYSLPEYIMEWAEYEKTQLSSYEALHNLQKAVR